MNKTATLVIARYKENIDWIYNITNPDINIVIINKQKTKPKLKKLPNSNTVKIICLQNFGREAHSYIYYISTFYYNLSDFTIFVQGNPFDHFSSIVEFINKKQYHKFIALNDISMKVSENSQPTEQLLRCLIEYPIKQKGHEYGPILRYVGFHFPCGAQFCVPRNYILSRPRIFWQSLFSYLKWKTNDKLPYWFERIFIMLFNPYYKINPDYINKIESQK